MSLSSLNRNNKKPPNWPGIFFSLGIWVMVIGLVVHLCGASERVFGVFGFVSITLIALAIIGAIIHSLK